MSKIFNDALRTLVEACTQVAPPSDPDLTDTFTIYGRHFKITVEFNKNMSEAEPVSVH